MRHHTQVAAAQHASPDEGSQLDDEGGEALGLTLLLPCISVESLRAWLHEEQRDDTRIYQHSCDYWGSGSSGVVCV
jgi:hypothetical protein